MITTTGQGVPFAALETIAAAGREAADAATLEEALSALARAAAAATGAALAVVRVPDKRQGELEARGLWADSPALAAELEGSRVPLAEVGTEELSDRGRMPEAVRRLAARRGAAGVLLVPAVSDDQVTVTLELMRPGEPFTPAERQLARIVAHQAGLLVRAFEAGHSTNGTARVDALELAGRALAAGGEETRGAERIARLAAEATGARSCVLWRTTATGPLPVAAVGAPDDLRDAARAAREADRMLGGRMLLVGAEEPPPGAAGVVLVRLGEPSLGGLRLVFAEDARPSDDELSRLAAFGAKAAHALRAGERSAGLAQELDRSRALLAVVGQAIAELSLSHTLETAAERVGELLGTERTAVYLRAGAGLEAAVERGLVGPHARVAEALLDLILGRLRARAVVEVRDARADPRLTAARNAVEEAGIEAAVAVPLRAGTELIGLLVAYLPAARRLLESESALLAALAGQLAVAVQNAGLHEETMRLAHDREQALEAERRAARRLEALYEISRSFSESLSLDETVAAVTRTVVELLGVDAAVLRMPDARGTTLVPRALHVPDNRLAPALASILSRPQPLDRLGARGPIVLDRETAEELGGGHELLTPFLARGSTAAVLPITASGEVMAALTLVSLDPARPIDADLVESGRSLAVHAALALENARLYQQQVHFANAMQRSLLPEAPPELPGVDVGSVYQSSARLDVGGDVFDFATLPDGRLAVVVGDVTGKGIDAAADMAMTKFVFRSLAREHPDPGEFLRFANEVVIDEVGEGKFVTMLYLTLNPETGDLACAGAGHPAPRLVGTDGRVLELAAGGLALGIAPDQEYIEAHARLEPGEAVVLFTDGVLESRRDGELYGHSRLDSLLSERRDLPAEALARAIVEDSRAFAGGGPADDSAVVVVKRT